MQADMVDTRCSQIHYLDAYEVALGGKEFPDCRY